MIADDIICRSLHTLAAWGFSLAASSSQSNAFEAVATAAAKHVKRTDETNERALSGKRIEQIYRAWLKEQIRDARCEGRLFVPTFNRWQVQSLRQRRPWATQGLSLQELADQLVSSKGHWLEPEDPGEVGAPHGDMLLTKTAHEEYLRIRPRLCRAQRLFSHES